MMKNGILCGSAIDQTMSRRILAVLLDCGDTLVDEGSEVRDSSGIVVQAELIPGAEDLLRELKCRGYRLGLVADGPESTFQNTLGRRGLYDLFDVRAISERVGVEKPDPRIFWAALDALAIRKEDYGRVVMVGNHLARDIRGANALGLVSVWLDWSPRRPKVPADEMERPIITIHQPLEFIEILEEMELDAT